MLRTTFFLKIYSKGEFMSITVCGVSIFLEHQKNRISYSDIPDKENKIGTIDATSCLGVVYRTSKSLYVQHLDDRPLDSLLDIFEEKSMHITLVGGCLINGRLEKHTQINIEKLLQFWKKHHFHIDLDKWHIGDGKSYASLCSDFVVDQNGIYLLQQGEVGQLNIIPQMLRRMATSLIDNREYLLLSNQVLELPALKDIDRLKKFAEIVVKIDDETFLQNFSSTPTLEPPYFPETMRKMAAFILAQKEDLPPLKVQPLKDQAVFALQGEIIQTMY